MAVRLFAAAGSHNESADGKSKAGRHDYFCDISEEYIMDAFMWIVPGVIAIAAVIYIFIPNKTVYQCPKCGQTFIPKKTELIGVHSFGKHLLKCPQCGHSSMMGSAGRR